MDDELDFQTEAKNIAEVATKTLIVLLRLVHYLCFCVF